MVEIYKPGVRLKTLYTLHTAIKYVGVGRDFRSSLFQLPTHCRDPQRILILLCLNFKVRRIKILMASIRTDANNCCNYGNKLDTKGKYQIIQFICGI